MLIDRAGSVIRAVREVTETDFRDLRRRIGEPGVICRSRIGSEVRDEIRKSREPPGVHAFTNRSTLKRGLSCTRSTAHQVSQRDHVQRVLAPNDGLALDLDALLPNVGTAEIVQERRARVRIHRRASFGSW